MVLLCLGQVIFTGTYVIVQSGCYYPLTIANHVTRVGVFEEVIERASLVLDAIQNSKHIERLGNDDISAQDQQYKVLKTERILSYSACNLISSS